MNFKDIIPQLSRDLERLSNSSDFPIVYFKKPGELIFEKGQPGKFMYLLRSGEVQIKEGDVVLRTIEEGDILGEMALIDNSPRSATAIALTKCELTPLDKRRFFFLVQRNPVFALYVMQVLVHRLRTLSERLAV